MTLLAPAIRPCTGALLAALAMPSLALADGTVSGVLFEQGAGTPVDGVTITVDGHGARTSTDRDGAFQLSLPAGSWTLRLSGAQSGEATGVVVADAQTTELLFTLANGSVQGVQMEAPPSAVPVGPAPEAADAVLTGQVLDDTGAPITGARVFVRGSTVEAQTDVEGRFSVPAAAGTHTLSVLHARYATQTVHDVAVSVNGTTPVEVRLVPAGLELEAFTVLAPAIDGGTATLLAERQDTSDVVDTVSAEEMSRRGDSSAASALKRVTGLTVIGGKYIYVRGMGERYSATLLNGSSLPSPEPTRRVVPLDLFPTAMLDSVVVQKTFSASMPADFGGGVLQLRTRGIPDELVARVGMSMTHTEGTTGEQGLFGPQYDGDFWGGAFGTGGAAARALPGDFAQQTASTPLVIKSALPGAQGFSTEEMESLSRALPNRWGLSPTQVPYDLGWNASLGNGWDVGTQSRVGALFGATFQNSWERREYREVYPNLNGDELQVQNEYDFEDLSNLVQLGVMGVIEGEITKEHSVRSTTFFVQDTEYLGRRYIGEHADIGDTIRVERTQYVARSMMVQQFVGEHQFPNLWNGFVNWRATWSGAGRLEPDRRDIILQPAEAGGWRLRTQGGGNGILYGALEDENYDAGIDLGFDIGDRDDKTRFSFTVQGGGSVMERTRRVDVRRFTYDLRTNPEESDTSFLVNEPQAIFDSGNISASQGLLMAETTAATDNSTGQHTVGAQYLQLETRSPWGTTLQTGLRREASVQTVRTFTLHQEPPEVVLGTVDKVDLLPAATLTQKLPIDVPGTMQVRLGYGRTLNRPSLRELSPAVYFGVVGGREVAGDPTITRALIDNYDARWEWYLSGDESISVGAFRKDFTDPIETNILRGAAAREVPVNATAAQNVGLELDLRKRMGWGTDTGWEDLVLSGNASFIRSSVDLSGADGAQTSTERPLQGQSPYVVNLQLGYEPIDFPLWGTVLYNIAGARIVEVGTNGLPDTLEQPPETLDLVLGWNITKGWSTRFKAGNILDSATTAQVGRMQVRNVQAGRSYGLSLRWGYAPPDAQ